MFVAAANAVVRRPRNRGALRRVAEVLARETREGERAALPDLRTRLAALRAERDALANANAGVASAPVATVALKPGAGAFAQALASPVSSALRVTSAPTLSATLRVIPLSCS
jgi:hypothetical protein